MCDVNPFGIVGLKAAYTSRGEEWLSQLIEYLHGNYRMVCDMLDKRFDITKLEGTYLPMIDVRSLGIPVVDLERQLLDEARVWVNSSSMYGCEGYLRINIATRRELLGEGVRRIIEFLKP